jgi:glycosyltransferase involved in cell wall biosynthesis
MVKQTTYLRALAKKLKIEDKVIFTGRISNTRLPELLQKQIFTSVCLQPKGFRPPCLKLWLVILILLLPISRVTKAGTPRKRAASYHKRL